MGATSISRTNPPEIGPSVTNSQSSRHHIVRYSNGPRESFERPMVCWRVLTSDPLQEGVHTLTPSRDSLRVCEGVGLLAAGCRWRRRHSVENVCVTWHSHLTPSRNELETEANCSELLIVGERIWRRQRQLSTRNLHNFFISNRS